MATDYQGVDSAEPSDRPVVLDTGSSAEPTGRSRRTVVAVVAAAVVAAGGLIAGTWSIWSAVSDTIPAEDHAPLWFSPPAPVDPVYPSAPPSSTTPPAK